MPDSSSPTPSPPFEQLKVLAYIEADRFCTKCAYNLRGQPVRREPAMELLLCRCPECGTFAPANELLPQAHALSRRVSKVAWGLWVFVALYLLIGAAVAMSAVVIGVVGELAQIDYRATMISPPPPEQMAAIARRYEDNRIAVRIAGLVGLPALALVCGLFWPVIFPHWRRWGYRLLAVAYPLIAVISLIVALWLQELRDVPAGTEKLVACMILGAIAAGLIGIRIARPTARGLLTLLLTERPRAAFSYLWMIDGKKPPSAKA